MPIGCPMLLLLIVAASDQTAALAIADGFEPNDLD